MERPMTPEKMVETAGVASEFFGSLASQVLALQNDLGKIKTYLGINDLDQLLLDSAAAERPAAPDAAGATGEAAASDVEASGPAPEGSAGTGKKAEGSPAATPPAAEASMPPGKASAPGAEGGQEASAKEVPGASGTGIPASPPKSPARSPSPTASMGGKGGLGALVEVAVQAALEAQAAEFQKRLAADAKVMVQEAMATSVDPRINAVEDNMTETTTDLNTQWAAWKKQLKDLKAHVLAGRGGDVSAVLSDQEALEEAMTQAQTANVTAREAKNTVGRVVADMNSMKELMVDLERRTLAAGTAKEGDAATRAMLDRLRRDLDVTSQQCETTATTAEELRAMHVTQSGRQQDTRTALDSLATKLESANSEMYARVQATAQALGEAAQKLNLMDANLDQMRQVQEQYAAAATRAEQNTQAQVNQLQGVLADGHGEMSRFAMGMEDVENRIASINTAMSTSLGSINNRLAAVAEQIKELHATKLSIASAVRAEDVKTAIAHALSAAEGKADYVLRAVAGLEERIELLVAAKADRTEVLMVTVFEQKAAELMGAMGAAMDELKAGVETALAGKAGHDSLEDTESRADGRIANLESAVLKGLKAISDKVAAALLEKAEVDDLQDFRASVRSRLADVDARLAGWTPNARALTTGADGRPVCLSCEARVADAGSLVDAYKRSPKGAEPRAVSPPTLPMQPKALVSLPGLSEVDPKGASINARAAQKKREEAAMLRSARQVASLDLPDIRGMPPRSISGRGNSLSGRSPTATAAPRRENGPEPDQELAPIELCGPPSTLIDGPDPAALPQKKFNPRLSGSTVSGQLAQGQVPARKAGHAATKVAPPPLNAAV